MLYKKFSTDAGDYEDANGLRYNVLECNEAIGPAGKDKSFKTYKNLENALKAFALKRCETAYRSQVNANIHSEVI